MKYEKIDKLESYRLHDCRGQMVDGRVVPLHQNLVFHRNAVRRHGNLVPQQFLQQLGVARATERGPGLVVSFCDNVPNRRLGTSHWTQ